MNQHNGKKKEIEISLDENKSTIIIPLPNLPKKNEKRTSNEIKIEDLLENGDILCDLKANPNSKFKNLLTTKNIFKLIDYCLLPKINLDKNSTKDLGYPYISCQILVSELVLLFSKSINNIKESNYLSLNPKVTNNNLDQSASEDKKQAKLEITSSPKLQVAINYINDDTFEKMNEKLDVEQANDNKYFDDYFHFKDVIGDEERYAEISETEIKKDTLSIKPITEYDEEGRKIINDILGYIFQKLKEDYDNNDTYMGYLQKIINYLLFNEANIILDYLFIEQRPIKLFYKHLHKAAIENIMENLLNILVDREDNLIDVRDSKYNIIILDLLNELDKDTKFEKAEYIFELITNTLINNSDKQLIELIFNKNKSILINFRTYIGIIINLETYKKNENKINFNKTIIGIMKILIQLNNIIINSFNESLYFQNNNIFSNIQTNVYKKINTFEYQYTIKRNLNINKIFEAYKNNTDIYLKEMNYIFNLIKEDIIKDKEKEEDKNKSNKKIFNIRHLFEWKFIASALSIYIYSFYTIEDFEKYNIYEYFNDKKLFEIMNKYYFNYTKNNIYQNTFVEIIKLICKEKCPEYLIKHFLQEKNNKRNEFIFKIIKNIKDEINKKYKLSLGANIELLRLIFNSNNPYILTIFQTFQKDNITKNIFNDFMNPKLERKLLDELDYSFSEIFNSENENNTTFDGNDVELKKSYNSFNKIIGIFLNKRKKVKIKMNIKNDNEENTNNINIVKIKIKQKYEDFKDNNNIYTIKDTKKMIEYKNDNNEINNNEKDEYFGIYTEEKFELEETSFEDKNTRNT